MGKQPNTNESNINPGDLRSPVTVPAATLQGGVAGNATSGDPSMKQSNSRATNIAGTDDDVANDVEKVGKVVEDID